jgi:tetratricopeptide (TPR) repeat protein
VPKKPTRIDILLSLIATKFVLAGKRIEDLVHLPEMTAPYALTATRLMLRVATCVGPKRLLFMACKTVRLSVKYGNTAASPYLYTFYGSLLCEDAKDTNTGYRFGKLALSLSDRFRESQVKTITVVNNSIIHWKEHLRITLRPLQEAHRIGVETGDLEFAAWAAGFSCWHAYWSGQELGKVEQEMASYSRIIAQLKQQTAYNYHNIQWQTVRNLIQEGETEGTSTPWQLIGDAYDETHMLPLHQQMNDLGVLLCLYYNKLFLSYLFQAYPQAAEYTRLTRNSVKNATGLFVAPQCYFYDSLVQLARYPEVDRSEQKRLLKQVAANQKKMKKWARHAPMNHLHKWYLVEAERARVRGKDHQAREYYDKAIELARKHEYVNEEALANELAAKFYLARGKDTLARTYMHEARYCYRKWGATAKVRHLEETYSDLLVERRDGRHCEREAPLPLSLTDTATGTTSAGVLDLATVMKASQTLSVVQYPQRSLFR